VRGTRARPYEPVVRWIGEVEGWRLESDCTCPMGFDCKHAVATALAWREHLGLSQAEVAGRIGITQAAYAQMERVKKPRKATLEKVASALGLEVEQLRW